MSRTAPPSRGVGFAVLVSSVTAVAALLASVVVAQGTPVGTVNSVAFNAAGALTAIVGGVVVRRRPSHTIGWLLTGTGLLHTLGGLAEAVTIATFVAGRAGLPVPYLAAWWMQWYWLPLLYGQLVFLPLLFPTGRAASPGWRVVVRLAVVAVLLASAGGMLQQELRVDIGAADTFPVVANPIGVLPFADVETGVAALLAFPPLLVSLVLGLVSLLVRYRRSRGVERQQMKFAVYGVGLAVGLWVVAGAADAAFGVVLPVVGPVALTLIPASLGLAVLRFRLWDIDRVISRTLSYLLVSAVLTATYVAIVLTAQAALGPADAPDLVVAGATLVVAALFRPLQSRLQHLVDRRFARARYEAATVVDEFGGTLRDVVDLPAIVGGVDDVVTRALAPASVSVWLRDGRT